MEAEDIKGIGESIITTITVRRRFAEGVQSSFLSVFMCGAKH